MNPVPKGALESGSAYHSTKAAEVVVFPTFLDLERCIKAGTVNVGGQCGRPESEGAFTGDISMKQLKDLGCTHVLCGHSESRVHHHETDAMVAAQVEAAHKEGLVPVLCIGETAEERAAGRTNDVLTVQLTAIFSTTKTALTNKNLIIAYEPVWAIGTGKTLTSADAQIAHAFIKSLLPSPGIRIIYGGSVTGKNAADFFKEPDIHGALVGGASLKPDDFGKIVAAAM